MSKIIEEDSVLQINSNVQLENLSLSAQEGFILSRIDGKLTVREIYQVSLLDKQATAAVLMKLVDQGALKIEESEKEQTQPKTDLPSRDYSGFIFDLVELQEEADLPLDLKKEILYVYNHLEKWTYYELLHVPPDTPASKIKEAVKRSFLMSSKLFHPDRYFRKELGSYGVKISKIYAELAKAQAVLTSPSQAEDYRRQLIEEGKIQAGPDDILEDPLVRNKRHKEEKRKSRLMRNPMLQRVQKAKSFYEAGEENMRKEEWISAANNFKFAIMHDPHNELYKLKAEQVKDLADKATAERIFQKALVLESYGQDGYHELFLKAAETYPSGVEFSSKVARMLWEQGEYVDALPFARRASQGDASNVDLRLLYGQLLVKNRKKAEAVKQFEAILKTDPENELAKSALKEAKKWF